MGWDSEDGIATGYGLDSRKIGVGIPVEAKIIAHTLQSPTQWISGAISHWLEWPWREVDHSAPTSAEIKETWKYISFPS
jgi:hypothetical protein